MPDRKKRIPRPPPKRRGLTFTRTWVDTGKHLDVELVSKASNEEGEFVVRHVGTATDLPGGVEQLKRTIEKHVGMTENWIDLGHGDPVRYRSAFSQGEDAFTTA